MLFSGAEFNGSLDYSTERLFHERIPLDSDILVFFVRFFWIASCRPQMGPMLAPWTLLLGTFWKHLTIWLWLLFILDIEPFYGNVRLSLYIPPPHSRVGRRGSPCTPLMAKFQWYPEVPISTRFMETHVTKCKNTPTGHLALFRGPKAQFWVELGQMSQCHINRFEWPCNMSKWGFSTMLSTMVTFVFWFWLEGSVINKFKMAANRHIGFWRKLLTVAYNIM